MKRFTYVRMSPIPYLATLIIGFGLVTYLHHLWQYLEVGIPVIKGQAVLVWGSGLTVALAILLWALIPWRPVRNPWGTALFAVLLLGWSLRLALMPVHGDAYPYSVWLYPMVLLMIAIKFPNLNEVRVSLLTLGWVATLLLVWTRLSELVGIFPMTPVPSWLVEFEVGEYWLPLAGTLGPDGRWPGPLGGTAFTGMLGAFLVVLAIALKTKSSWAFGVVGVLTLLLTSSRGAFAATAAGVGVAIIFSQWSRLARVSFKWRIAIALGGAAATFAVLLRASPNLTGRTTFWPDFLELWLSEPILGVGGSGYLEGSEWTQSAGSAHSFFIDELSRNGLLGFTVLLATFAIALGLGLKSAQQREGGPLALLTTMTVLGIANTPFTWLTPSLLWLFLIFPTVWALAVAIRARDTPELVTRL